MRAWRYSSCSFLRTEGSISLSRNTHLVPDNIMESFGDLSTAHNPWVLFPIDCNGTFSNRSIELESDTR